MSNSELTKQIYMSSVSATSGPKKLDLSQILEERKTNGFSEERRQIDFSPGIFAHFAPGFFFKAVSPLRVSFSVQLDILDEKLLKIPQTSCGLFI